MIARVWRGAVRREDAEAYGAYINETGIAEYAGTAGNRGAWLLRRDEGDLATVRHVLAVGLDGCGAGLRRR